MKYTYSFFDLWPYFIITCTFLFAYLKPSKRNSYWIFLILFLFSALRFDIGWDYTAYVETIKNSTLNNFTYRFEPLSYLIFNLANNINFYPLVFITFAYLSLKLTNLSINRFSRDVLISWVAFYALPLFFFASLSTIRQSLATILILYSFQYIHDKKLLKFIITILVATFIHYSSILGILLYPISLSAIDKKVNWIIFISSFFVSNFVLSFMLSVLSIDSTFSRLLFYIENVNYEFSLLGYLYYSIGIINLIFYDRLTKINPLNKIFITISNFGLFLFNALKFEPISAGRISAFFLIFWIFIIPNYQDLFKSGFKRTINSLIFLLLLSLSFFYISIYIKAYNYGVLEKISFIPYRFWWDNI